MHKQRPRRDEVQVGRIEYVTDVSKCAKARRGLVKGGVCTHEISIVNFLFLWLLLEDEQNKAH